MYHPDSIKSMERRRRRSGDKLILTVICTKEPKCWNKFLSINKIGVKCLGNEFNSFAFNKTFTLYHLHSTSFRTKVQVQVSGLKSLQEETVTPVILYCMYAKQKGYKNARKRTSVSDISFICLYYAKTELQVKKYLYWYRKRQQQTIN